MSNTKLMNLLLNKLYNSNLDLEVYTSFSLYNDNNTSIPMIQINLVTKYLTDFAIYFSLNEDYFNYSSAFYVNDVNDTNLNNILSKEISKSAHCIFKDYSFVNDKIIELSNSLCIDIVTEDTIDNILKYITSSNKLIEYLNSIKINDFGIDYDPVTNNILKKFYQSNLNPELTLSIDTSIENAVQIQLNLTPKFFEDFAIFYGTLDNSINYCSIFEVKDSKDENIGEIFNNDKHIFKDLIPSHDYNEIHLYSNIKKNAVNDDLINKIIDYLNNDHPLIKYLNSVLF